MTYDITIDGKDVPARTESSRRPLACQLDGREVEVDAVLARPDVLSLRIGNQATK